MQQSLLIHRLNHADLNIYHCGTEKCAADHYYGPAVRDHFLIHYIHSGKGKFYIGEQEYVLQKGQGFLICPDIVTFYQADHDEPWSYSWIGFHGLKAESYLKKAGLALDCPIFSDNNEPFMDNCFLQIMEARSLQNGREIRITGLLYVFLSQLVEQNSRDRSRATDTGKKDDYIKKIIEYIEMNYSRKMSIAEMAKQIGLDRSYLGSLFKKQLNTSLRDFLLRFRMDKACELMKNNELSIGDISRSVGYDDPLLFSKLFKQTKGKPPREYRKDYQKGID